MIKKPWIISVLTFLAACAPQPSLHAPASKETAATSEAEESDAPFYAHMDFLHEGDKFIYTVHNDQPHGSAQFLTTWSLSPSAEFSIVSVPDGWKCNTDGASTLDCANDDGKLPYPHDIGPGGTARFVIESKGKVAAQPFILSAWDHANDKGGPILQGEVMGPSNTIVPAKEEEEKEGE